MSETANPNPKKEVPSRVLNLVYFVSFLGIGSVSSFMPLYLHENKGLSVQEIGIFGVLRPACTTFAAPFWTGLSDKMSAHKPVYTYTTSIAALVRGLYILAPGFWACVAVLLCAEGLGAGSGAMLDGCALAVIPDPADWGKHRLWGAIGFGGAVLLVGICIDVGGYSLMFATHTLFTFAAVALAKSTLPLSAASKRKAGKPTTELGLRTIASIVGSSLDRVIFFAVVLLCGVCTGVIENFLFVFLQDELLASKTLIGLSRTVTCVSEVPMFWFSASLIRRLGTRGVLALACLCYVVRFWCYAALRDPQLVLLIEPLHGVTYAVMWNASAEYAHRIAPAGLGATSQGLLSAFHWGIGQGAGALIGGALYSKYGSRAMFRLTSAFAATSLFLLIVAAVRAVRHPPSRVEEEIELGELLAPDSDSTDATV